MSSMPVSPSPTTPNNNNSKQIKQQQHQQREQKLAPKAAVPPPQTTSRPTLLSPIYTSSSSSAGGAADIIINHNNTTTTTTTMLAVAPTPSASFRTGRPIPVLTSSSSFQSSTEEYNARMRQWHNDIGKKYRNKLNDKFEGLQAVLVEVALNPDLQFSVAGSTSSGSPRGGVDEYGDRDVAIMGRGSGDVAGQPTYAQKLEILKRMQEDDDEDDDHDMYDEDEDGAEEDDDDADPGRASVRGAGMRRPRRRRTKGINKAKMLAMARKTIVRLTAERDQLERELAEGGNETE